MKDSFALMFLFCIYPCESVFIGGKNSSLLLRHRGSITVPFDAGKRG